VLGIDPGLSRCGFGCVDRRGEKRVVVAAGVVTTSRHLDLPARLMELDTELRALVSELSPEVVVVERVLFQTNARTAMSVGQAAGLAIVAAAQAGCVVTTYSSNEVKLAVAGWGAASKDQVQRMVAMLCELAEPPRPPDVADALALALCHLNLARGQARLEAALRS
jgi:crossover junction endodeoxyribonuclease RuvC